MTFTNIYTVGKTQPAKATATASDPKVVLNASGDDLYFSAAPGPTREVHDGFLPVGEAVEIGATLHLLSESSTRVIELAPEPAK